MNPRDLPHYRSEEKGSLVRQYLVMVDSKHLALGMIESTSPDEMVTQTFSEEYISYTEDAMNVIEMCDWDAAPDGKSFIGEAKGINSGRVEGTHRAVIVHDLGWLLSETDADNEFCGANRMVCATGKKGVYMYSPCGAIALLQRAKEDGRIPLQASLPTLREIYNLMADGDIQGEDINGVPYSFANDIINYFLQK